MAEDILFGEDGLRIRKSGDYAKDKLHYVRRYMDIFSNGMKKSWKHRVYLDLMAGPGKCRVKTTGEEFPGSPLLSLEAQMNFTRQIFVEEHSELADALRRRTTGHPCQVIEGNCTATGVLNQLRDATAGDDVLGLAFVDNLGLDVPFRTLANLIDHRAIDLLVVIQLQDIRRNVRTALTDQTEHNRFAEFFGSPRWSEHVKDLVQNNATPSALADALIALYFDMFRSIGHEHADQVNYAVRNSNNATQYRLAIISRHPLAVTYLGRIGAIEPDGQRPFSFE